MNTPSLPWHTILDRPLGERAREAIKDIARALCKPESACVSGGAPVTGKSQVMADASLASGQAGLAILYAYLAKAELCEDAEETALVFLNEAIEAIGAVSIPPSLYGGFAGVAWTAAHLEGWLFDAGEDDPNEAIDEVLLDYLQQSPWRGDYDLVSGLVGLGVYALERLPRPAALACLECVLDRLAETAEKRAEGIAWFTPPELLPASQRADAAGGYYNLGLAHGVPGVIALLAAACAAGRAAKARPLLDGAVSWLLTQKLAHGTQSTFSCWTAPGNSPQDCRLGWCYGDAGIAAALMAAARAVGNAVWEREALGIARRAAERSPATAGVRDAGLCHGAAGLGHIFNRFFQATGEVCFRQAACYWFEQTLLVRRPGHGVAGFSSYFPATADGQERWLDDPGVLTGAAGIALALLAAVMPIEPVWDRMLLVAIPNVSLR